MLGAGSPEELCALAAAGRTVGGDQAKEHPITVGYAKALTAAPVQPVQDVSFAMPETYWFMGETWPCTGDHPQEGLAPSALPSDSPYPTVCTSGMSYRAFRNEPAEAFVQYLFDAAAAGSDRFRSMCANLTANRQPAGSPSVPNTGNRVWPMFSLENLSGSRDSTAAPSGPTCLARHYYGRDQPTNNVCGTFDGLSHWTWERTEALLRVFAYASFGDWEAKGEQPPTLALYEAQFVPPQWTRNGRYVAAPPSCFRTGGGGNTLHRVTVRGRRLREGLGVCMDSTCQYPGDLDRCSAGKCAPGFSTATLLGSRGSARYDQESGSPAYACPSGPRLRSEAAP